MAAHFVPDRNGGQRINLNQVARLVAHYEGGYTCFTAGGKPLGEIDQEEAQATPPIIPNQTSSVLISFYFIEHPDGQREVSYSRYTIVAWRIIHAATVEAYAEPVVADYLEDDGAVNCIEEQEPSSSTKRWIFRGEGTFEVWTAALRFACDRLTWKEQLAAKREARRQAERQADAATTK